MPDYVDAKEWGEEIILRRSRELYKDFSERLAIVQRARNGQHAMLLLEELLLMLANLHQLSVAYRYEADADLAEQIGADGELSGCLLTYDMISQVHGPSAANLSLDAARDMAKGRLADLLPEIRNEILFGQRL